MTTEPKPLPKPKTDKDAEDFVDTADLTEFDMSEFKPVRFEMKAMPDEIFLNQNNFEWRDIDMGDPNDIRYIRADRAEQCQTDTITLNESEAKRMVDACENPKPPNDALLKAIKAHIGIDLADKPDFNVEHVVIPRDVLDAINALNKAIDEYVISDLSSERKFYQYVYGARVRLGNLLKPYVKGGCDD